jgi:CubicO group peptidase (beta-lactamase class C family)
MGHVLKYVCVLAFALVGTRALADDTDRKAELDAIVDGADGITTPLSGLQVVVIKGGEPVFEYAGGFAQLTSDGNGKIPLRVDHKVRVASISKLVVALGIMKLAEDGRIKLDEDVGNFVGFKLRNPGFPKVPITVRQLLSHTSSVSDADRYWLELGKNYKRFFDREEHFETGKRQLPGTYFRYSNLGYGVLGGVIERASRKRFDRYMQQNILRPLGLSASFSACEVPPDKLAATFRKNDANGRWIANAPWRVQNDGKYIKCYYGGPDLLRTSDPGTGDLDYRLGSNPTLFSPQGGLRASARDLAVIMKMMIDGGVHDGQRFLEPETIKAMQREAWRYDPDLKNGVTSEFVDPNGALNGLMTSWGLGVHRINLKDWGITDEKRVLVGHLGEAYGLLGQFLYDPKTGDGFIALLTGTARDPLSDVYGSSPLYGVEERLLRWWLENF